MWRFYGLTNSAREQLSLGWQNTYTFDASKPVFFGISIHQEQGYATPLWCLATDTSRDNDGVYAVYIVRVAHGFYAFQCV